MGHPVVSVNVNMIAEDRGSYWVGKVERMGVLVYAESFNGLRERVDKAVGMLLSGSRSLDSLVDYLDRHDIDHKTQPLDDRDHPRSLRIGRELQVAVA